MNINTGHSTKLFKYYKSTIAVIIILVLSFLPADNADKVKFFDIPHLDKIVHFIMYFLLSFMLLIDFHNNKQKLTSLFILSILSVLLIFSGIIEMFQELFISDRSGSFYDIIANFTGIVFGYLIYSKTKIKFFFKKMWF